MRDEVEVLLVMLDEHLPVPGYAHPGDAGADLVTAVDVELPPFGRVTVPTGVSIALPDGYAAFIHPRSGLAARHGVTVTPCRAASPDRGWMKAAYPSGNAMLTPVGTVTRPNGGSSTSTAVTRSAPASPGCAYPGTGRCSSSMTSSTSTSSRMPSSTTRL